MAAVSFLSHTSTPSLFKLPSGYLSLRCRHTRTLGFLHCPFAFPHMSAECSVRLWCHEVRSLLLNLFLRGKPCWRASSQCRFFSQAPGDSSLGANSVIGLPEPVK